MLTMTRPSSSEHSEAPTNQSIALPPTRPTEAVSPMCAMPTTRVENTRGAMIILMRRRKTSLISAMYPEISLEVCGSGQVMLHR
jgi:hypothetical protein